MKYIKSWGLSLITSLGLAQPTTIQQVTHQSQMIGTTQITIVQGDITEQRIDAIVNAANELLSHCSGLAHAISKAAGAALQEYSNEMPIISNGQRCPIGTAVITPAFDLEKSIGIKKIIHATGSRGDTPNKEQLLQDTYNNILQVAIDNNLRKIAIPAISTALFGYDINEATPIALKTVKTFVASHPNAFDEIRFVLFSDKDFAVYQKYMKDQYTFLSFAIKTLLYIKNICIQKATNILQFLSSIMLQTTA